VENILLLEGVHKAYENHIAVNNVSLAIPRQSIFGLLGPNGAGKTSLIRIITTITRADKGVVYFNGEKLNTRHPEQIGYMPEERGLYKKMKVGEHLLYLAKLKGLSTADAKKAIDVWIEKFEISGWWDKKVDELSKGMQQKIQFIATVVHKPQLLILDEPFSGLDPINSNLIKEEIRLLNEQGTSIIFSTHRMEQVEEICERIGLINNGKLVLEGRVKDIQSDYKENIFKVSFAGQIPEVWPDGMEIRHSNNGFAIFHLDEGVTPNHLLLYAIQQGLQVVRFEEILPSINEIFIKKVSEKEA